MLVKVLIKRHFRQGHEREIIALLNDLRSKAMQQLGYVSGITMVDPNDPQTMLVIGTWQKMEDWNTWKQSRERKNFDSMLEIYQIGEADYQVYVVGAPFEP